MPHSLGLCGTAVPYDMISNLFMGIFYKDETMMNEALVLAEKFLAGETNLVCRKMDGDDTSPSIYS